MKNIPKVFLSFLFVVFTFLFVSTSNVFALTDEEKQEYAEIEMIGATGVNGNNIIYEHGSLEPLEEDEAPIVETSGGKVFVYTKQQNQQFAPDPEEGYQLFYIDDEEQHVPVNGDFNMVNLLIGKHHEAKLAFEDEAQVPPREFAVTFSDDATWNINDVVVTASVEGKNLSDGFEKLTNNDTIHFENFNRSTMEVVIFDGDQVVSNLIIDEDNNTNLTQYNSDAIPDSFEIVVRAKQLAAKVSVNFQGNQWIFGEHNDIIVTASVEGKNLSNGPVELDYDETIHLENFNPGSMRAYVSGDGVKAYLTVNEQGDTHLDTRDVQYIPGEVAFEIEEVDNSNDYSVNFGNGSWQIGDVTVTASINGNQVNGNMSIKGKTSIELTNFNPETMEIHVSATDGFNTTLRYSEDSTSLNAHNANGGLPDTLTFEIVAKNNNQDPGPGPEYNTNATINITAGNGSYTHTVINEQTHEEEEVDTPYDNADTEIFINGSRFDREHGTVAYNLEEGATTVDMTFEVMWTDRLYENIEINGTSYDVTDYLDFDNRTAWLRANHGSQTVEFTIPNVPVSNTYNVTIKHGRNNMPVFFANFLWTANPDNQFVDDSILHSKLEFVKAVYTVGDNTYTITEQDLKDHMVNDGDFKVGRSEDGFLSYGILRDVNYDDGGLTLPGNSYVTMRVVPDYGYQVTSVNGGNNFSTNDSGVSEFTIFVPDGTNGYFNAEVTPVDDKVVSNTDKVSEGTVAITNGDVDSGTVVLSVDDVELSQEKITNFQDALNESDGNYSVNSYLDINLDQVFYKGTADSVWSNRIHNLDNDATITLKIDENVDVSKLVIVHNINDGEEFEIIPIDSYDAENHTITFKTKSFSNYAIAEETTCTTETREIIKVESKATLTKDGVISVSRPVVCKETGKVVGGAGESRDIYHPTQFVLSKSVYNYNGDIKRPSVKIYGSNNKQIPTSFYTVKYSKYESKKVGEYKITITFKGEYYEGTKVLTYRIVPKTVKLKKVTSLKKSFKAYWAKNTTQTTGYQLIYSTDKKFKKNYKKVTIKDNKQLAKTIKKLKAKTTYYVGIRTYKTITGGYAFSNWSNIIKVKTK